jgi:hypothetical protein
MACRESADKRTGKDDPTRGVGVRACVQCGLSISETATFCQVCGVRYEVDPVTTTLEATQVVEGPPADDYGPAGGADRWSDAQPYEPGAELVADLAAEPETSEPATSEPATSEPVASEPEASEPETSEPVASEPESAGASDCDADVGAGTEPAEAGPDPEAPPPAESDQAAPEAVELEPKLEEAAPAPAPLEPELAEVAPELEADPAEPGAPEPNEPEVAPEPEPEPDPGPEVAPEPAPEPGARDRKLAAVAVILEAASVCEDADMSRAAALYQEAILGCLDAADDAGGFAGVERELLRGFDGLSALLERRGLAEEALEVVDDAAALSLLDGRERVAGGHCDVLLVRRENLRRLLYADSASL